MSIDTNIGRYHDFKIWKNSKKKISSNVLIIGDSAYTGMQKYHANCIVVKRRKRGKILTKEDRVFNQNLSK